jgi:hypothetical protein
MLRQVSERHCYAANRWIEFAVHPGISIDARKLLAQPGRIGEGRCSYVNA